MTREERIEQLKGWVEEVIQRSEIIADKDEGTELQAQKDHDGPPGAAKILVRSSTRTEVWTMKFSADGATYDWVKGMLQ